MEKELVETLEQELKELKEVNAREEELAVKLEEATKQEEELKLELELEDSETGISDIYFSFDTADDVELDM